MKIRRTCNPLWAGIAGFIFIFIILEKTNTKCSVRFFMQAQFRYHYGRILRNLKLYIKATHLLELKKREYFKSDPNEAVLSFQET